jgi:oxygen-dependent protoporphyrinogen oxidase
MSETPLRSATNVRGPVAVLGGGITGLTAAWQLHRAGVPVVVFEATARTGGVIGAERDQGWLHEGGPNSILEGSADVTALIEAVGLGARRVYAGSAAKQRFVVKGGRLVAMPASPVSFLKSGLFSWRAKLGILAEPFRRRRTLATEESVAAFVLRRLGPEFLDYAIDPFVAGVYAGDPRELSLAQAFPKLHALERDYGSLIRGAIKRRNPGTAPRGRILTFPNGLEELPAALAGSLGESVRRQCSVRELARTEAGWRVGWERDGVRADQDFAAVISALPPDALAGLPIRGVEAASGLAVLRDIAQPPVVSLFTGFRREDVAHPLDGFGFLVPRVENRRILGCLFSSTLFPGRAPAGHVALTTFVGGTRQPELALMDNSTLLEIVLPELRALLGVRGEPVLARWRRWSRAIPQYNVGYQRFKDACSAAEASAPGLFIGGNVRDGISLSACVESGRRLAAAVSAYLP